MSKNTQSNNDEEEIDPEESPRIVPQNLALDLGDDNAGNADANRLECQSKRPSDCADGKVQESAPNSHKREDNPFSFKHFLRDSSSSTTHRNYQSLGARPKVYGRDDRSRHTTPPASPQRQTSRNLGEFSSALPDFVQDHLVIEQSFLANKFKPSTSDVNLGLPDFTQDSRDNLHNPNVSRSNSIEDPLLERIPLDLPGLSSANAFPLDLPLPSKLLPHSDAPTTEVGNSKSLPDFLTDGPVRNTTDGSSVFVPDREQTSRCRHCAQLSAQMLALLERYDRTEDELDKNYRRAAAAENSVARLKLELKTLKAQLREVQAENEMLREGAGEASGGGGDPPMELRLAQELRAAASTAEHSLRALLTGVDNLRVMASTLENLNRVEVKPMPDRFSEFEGDNVGPNL